MIFFKIQRKAGKEYNPLKLFENNSNNLLLTRLIWLNLESLQVRLLKILGTSGSWTQSFEACSSVRYLMATLSFTSNCSRNCLPMAENCFVVLGYLLGRPNLCRSFSLGKPGKLHCLTKIVHHHVDDLVNFAM